MERLIIRNRREITQKPAHPISEAMPTLLLAMALITSPTTVITTNDRYDAASLSPTRFRRSTVQLQTECVSEPAISTERSAATSLQQTERVSEPALSTERSAATSLQPTNPVEAEWGTSPAAELETWFIKSKWNEFLYTCRIIVP